MSWQKFEPANPAGLAGYFQNAEEIFPKNSSLGWFVNHSAKCCIPAIRLRQMDSQRTIFWIQPDRVMDPKGARRRMDEKIISALSHFIPHDVNGKVMGIDGVLEAWKDTCPDAETALDDIRMIRASLDPLRKLAAVLSWLAKDKPEHTRPFSLFELYATFAEALPRHFKPANSLQFQPPQTKDAAHESILAVPHLLALWFLGTSILLSALKKNDETVFMSFNNTADHHHLMLQIQCEAFVNLFESQTSESPQIFWDWLTLFAHQNGTWRRTQDGMELMIPLTNFRNSLSAKIWALGSATDFNAEDASLCVITDISPASVAENFIRHVFDFDRAQIGASVEPNQREILVDLLASIRDIQLVDPSRKLLT